MNSSIVTFRFSLKIKHCHSLVFPFWSWSWICQINQVYTHPLSRYTHPSPWYTHPLVYLPPPGRDLGPGIPIRCKWPGTKHTQPLQRTWDQYTQPCKGPGTKHTHPPSGRDMEPGIPPCRKNDRIQNLPATSLVVGKDVKYSLLLWLPVAHYYW